MGGGKATLQPVAAVPQEDAWAYTPEFRRQLEEALRDVREGRVRQLTEAEPERIANEADRGGRKVLLVCSRHYDR